MEDLYAEGITLRFERYVNSPSSVNKLGIGEGNCHLFFFMNIYIIEQGTIVP